MDEIKETINSTCFSVDDFNFNDQNYNELLRISFKHAEDYCFSLSEEDITEEITAGRNFELTSRTTSKTITKLYSHESPGAYKKEDKIELNGYSRVCERITIWCKNMHHELSIETSSFNDIEDAKRAFNEQFEINIDDPESKFNSDEVSQLQSRLDELYSKFEQLSEKYEISENELKKLKSELNTIKENAKNYKKGLWAKVSQNKITDLIFSLLKSKESRDLIIDSIKKIAS